MDLTKLNKMQLTETFVKKNFPNIYKEVINLPPTKFQEKLYWYQYKLNDYPKCPICGGKPTFICFSQGYRKYCSRKCLNSDPQKIEKTKQICRERYGGCAPACSTTIQNKAKQTCQKLYGADYAMQSSTIQQKANKTIQEKYGCDWSGSIPGRSEKARQTCLKKYGGIGFESQELTHKAQQTNIDRHGDPFYNNYQQSVETQRLRYGGVGCESEELKQKYQDSRRSNILSEKDFLIGYTENGDWICKCPHPGCEKCAEKTYIISGNRYGGRQKEGCEPCTHLLPVQKSHSVGTTIEMFVRNILDENNVEYETNKGIFDGKHADIWIPAMNLAIELNGTYYHSTLLKPSNYHIKKFKCAQSKGIRLLTFWSDQIYNHPEIVKSMILTKIGALNETIYARKCVIKEVDGKSSAQFLESNHIQGSTPTSIRYGLYYENRLVSLMTFSQKTGCQGSKNRASGEWTLNRFCNVINTRVIGAASKLLKHFIRQHNPDTIISFSHNDISDGHLYEVLGFVSDHKINTSYYYVKGNKRWHRSTFTKAGIVSKGWRDKIDSSWTEREVMREQKFLCIYDSGTQKWVWAKYKI